MLFKPKQSGSGPHGLGIESTGFALDEAEMEDRMATEVKVKIDKARVEEVVADIVGQMEVIEKFGQVADHVEGIKDIDVSRFGMAVVMADGSVITGGEAEVPFAIQSISKVFALTMALEALGDEVWKRVGREPSGDPFNSIIDLERQKGIPAIRSSMPARWSSATSCSDAPRSRAGRRTSAPSSSITSARRSSDGSTRSSPRTARPAGS